LYTDVKAHSRQLWHEAKSLELIAAMTDELVEAQGADGLQLSAHDIERLERVAAARRKQLDAELTLAQLARAGGFKTRRG